MNSINKIFLSSRFIVPLIIINGIIIFIHEQIGSKIQILENIDIAITFIFIIEMIVKINYFSFKNYIADNWNKMDFVLILITLPTVFSLFLDIHVDLSFVLVFRLLRLFRLFRIIKFLPNVEELLTGLIKAIRSSYIIFFALIIIIFIISLFNGVMFKHLSPEFFATPMTSFYSTFRLFTVDGWHEIPDSIVANLEAPYTYMVRGYFSLLLLIGGIIGLSLLNSVFVDAMITKNEEDEINIAKLNDKIDEINQKIDKITK